MACWPELCWYISICQLAARETLFLVQSLEEIVQRSLQDSVVTVVRKRSGTVGRTVGNCKEVWSLAPAEELDVIVRGVPEGGRHELVNISFSASMAGHGKRLGCQLVQLQPSFALRLQLWSISWLHKT